MKKINAKHDNRDRIVCVTDNDKYRFYYNPVRSSEHYWLFDTKALHPSIFSFFLKHGRSSDNLSFSITVKELYKVGKSRDSKINKVLDRIPGQVEYVLHENFATKDECEALILAKKSVGSWSTDSDRDCAA